MAHDGRAANGFWTGPASRHSASGDAQLAILVEAHRQVFDLLLDATKRLSYQQWEHPTGCPGWDVHDQLAHCVGVECCMMGDPVPTVEVLGAPTEFLRAVEADVLARRSVAHQRVRDEAVTVFQRRMHQLTRMAPSVLTEEMVGPGEVRLPGATMLRLRLFDLLAHEQDIRRALGRLREPGGLAARVVGDHLLQQWSRHWSRVLAGPGALTVEIVGEEPATRVIELGNGETDAPRTWLRGSLSQLLPLACGRGDAPDGHAVFAGGDEELARRAVATAAMTP